MTLTDTLLKRLDDPALTRDERARLRCEIAAGLEHRGRYEEACDALADLWGGTGRPPSLEGLSEQTTAEVLLRVGALSGWLGSARQVEGAQEAAKDLISESITRFRALGDAEKIAVAQSELGLCYRRAGAYGEARVLYHEALSALTSSCAHKLRAKTLLRLVAVEMCCGRYHDALRLLQESAGFFEEGDDVLKGKFHNELGLALRKLGTVECRPDYLDRAIIEYTAASHHFELAGHTSYCARAENNLGFLLHTVGRSEDAHRHLSRARRLFLADEDVGSAAQVDETRTRVLLAEGRTREAEHVIRGAVKTLERGGEQAHLAEALMTHGLALSRLGKSGDSLATLKRAAYAAETAGATEGAGLALLTLMEEHADWLAEHELLETYLRADGLLRNSQDAEAMMRLRTCASRIASARLVAVAPALRRSRADFWSGFDLFGVVHAFEARYVRRALKEARGSVTRAARLLGLRHHATLAAMLEERHKDLAYLRTRAGKRRKSVVTRRPVMRPQGETRTVRILHVEDDKFVADMVKETLEASGWVVETCADGSQAAEILLGDTPYDLIIFDNDLPGQSGIELVRQARSLPYRKRLPLVILSAGEVETEAWRAGVSSFLRKPDDVNQLVFTVRRLLKLKK